MIIILIKQQLKLIVINNRYLTNAQKQLTESFLKFRIPGNKGQQ